MDSAIRHKLDMAGRVRDFCRTHPDPTNPGYTAAVDQLEEKLTRAITLAQQQVSGQLTVTGAVASTQELRQEIKDIVDLLAGIARAASRELPELKAGITRLPLNVGHQELLTNARVALATATAHQDLLVRHGLAAHVLETFGGTLDEFEKAINERHGGRLSHVGARADLEAVTADIMALVDQLAAINRFRFRNDAESLAAWKSARNVAWPLSPVKEEPESGTEKPAA